LRYGVPGLYSPKCLEGAFCENFPFTGFSEVRPPKRVAPPASLTRHDLSQEDGGIGVARLKDSPDSEARIVAEWRTAPA
jgi:hypothetical protein